MPAEFMEALQRVPAPAWITGCAVAFVLLLALLAFLHGVVKQLMNMVCLAAGGAAAWYCFHHQQDLFGASAATMSTDRVVLLAGVAGLLVYGVSRFIMRLLPWLGIVQLAWITGWRAGLLSLIPSGFTLWASTMATQLVGNRYGMEGMATLAQQGEQLQSHFGSWITEAQRLLDQSSVGSLLMRVDPLAVRATANLTRLLIVSPHPQVFPALAAHPRIGKIFHHPKVTALSRDPAVNQAIESKNFAGLLQLPQVQQAAADAELRELLSDNSLEDAMDEILYGRAPNRR